MKKERNVNIDYIKTLGIIATILIHITCLASRSEITSITWKILIAVGSILRYCVPIFCMSTGYLMYGRDKMDMRYVFKKYILKFFIILICVEIVYRFTDYLYATYYYNKPFDLVWNIKNILLGNTRTHLYYLWIMILIYTLYPILKLIMDKEEGELEYLIGAWLALSVIPVFIYGLTDKTMIIPRKQFIFGSYYNFPMFVLLGAYLNKYQDKFKGMKFFPNMLIIFSASVLTIYTYLRSEWAGSGDFYYWNSVNLMTFGLSVGIFVKGLNTDIENKLVKGFVIVVSKNTLIIYLFHIIFTDIFLKFGYSFNYMNGYYKIISYVGEFIFVFISSLIIGIIYHSIKKKILKIIGGI